MVAHIGPGTGFKQAGQSRLEGFLPGADLGRMDLELPGQLGCCLGSLQGFKPNLGFELSAVISSLFFSFWCCVSVRILHQNP